MRKKQTGDTHIQLINSPVVYHEDYDKVVIKWSWEDVQSLRPDLSEKESLVMLHKIAGRLEDRLIEMGWQVMEILIQMNEEADE
jgi:hypothetical protein